MITLTAHDDGAGCCLHCQAPCKHPQRRHEDPPPPVLPPLPPFLMHAIYRLHVPVAPLINIRIHPQTCCCALIADGRAPGLEPLFGDILPLSVETLISQTTAKASDKWYDLVPGPVRTPPIYARMHVRTYNQQNV